MNQIVRRVGSMVPVCVFDLKINEADGAVKLLLTEHSDIDRFIAKASSPSGEGSYQQDELLRDLPEETWMQAVVQSASRTGITVRTSGYSPIGKLHYKMYPLTNGLAYVHLFGQLPFRSLVFRVD